MSVISDSVKNFKINIPNDVRYLLSGLNADGYDAYIVGGCVRDALLGVVPKDWDITTNAQPSDIKRVFKNLRLILTGEKFGTVIVVLNGEPYEITTYRTDGVYTDGRRPDAVTFANTIKDDLSRRDLTINVMAYNDKDGLIDYFNGFMDLQNKTIKCVGDPLQRFAEDSLRVMRAIRFAVKLDFNISDLTVDAIMGCVENLLNVSQERKTEELIKILKNIKNINKETSHYGKICMIIKKIIMQVVPEFNDITDDAFNHTMDMIFMSNTDDIDLLFTVLLNAFRAGGMAKRIMVRMRLESKTIENVLLLIDGCDYSIQNNRIFVKKLLNKYGLDLSLKLLQFHFLKNGIENDQNIITDAIALCRKIVNNGEPFTLAHLAINGNDIIKSGFQPGKWIGEALNECLDYVINDPNRNNKNDLIEYINKI